MFRAYSVLVTLCEIGEAFFRLFGASGFHVEAENENFPAQGSRCRRNLKYENFTWLFGRLRQNFASKSVPHVQRDCFSLFNQLNR